MERTEPHHPVDPSHTPFPSLSPPTSHPELQNPIPTLSRGGQEEAAGVAALLHCCIAAWGTGGKEGEEGAETSGPSREGGWRRQLLPPRLSLSAGFTWIGRFICNRAQGDSVRAGMVVGGRRQTHPHPKVHRYIGAQTTRTDTRKRIPKRLQT